MLASGKPLASITSGDCWDGHANSGSVGDDGDEDVLYPTHDANSALLAQKTLRREFRHDLLILAPTIRHIFRDDLPETNTTYRGVTATPRLSPLIPLPRSCDSTISSTRYSPTHLPLVPAFDDLDELALEYLRELIMRIKRVQGVVVMPLLRKPRVVAVMPPPRTTRNRPPRTTSPPSHPSHRLLRPLRPLPC